MRYQFVIRKRGTVLTPRYPLPYTDCLYWKGGSARMWHVLVMASRLQRLSLLDAEHARLVGKSETNRKRCKEYPGPTVLTPGRELSRLRVHTIFRCHPYYSGPRGSAFDPSLPTLKGNRERCPNGEPKPVFRTCNQRRVVT
jgi:hypothetical protein